MGEATSSDRQVQEVRAAKSRIGSLFASNLRLIFFRCSKAEFDSFGNSTLLFGLIVTWIVGMGRWWDDPGAAWAQKLGLGSLIYVVVLSAIIRVLILPLDPSGPSYKKVLTFVSLTALPAILYATPVEKFLSLEAAVGINLLFLAIVALWRVALYFYFLRCFAKLSWDNTFLTGLLPLTAIVTTLVILNLHRVAFDIMGGIREPSAHDGEYSALFLLTMFSQILFIPLLVAYFIAVFIAIRKRRKAAAR